MKKIFFNSYDNKKFELDGLPMTAKCTLERINDKVDGESTLLVVRDGQEVIATFSSVVSFYVSTLSLTQTDGQKDFI